MLFLGHQVRAATGANRGWCVLTSWHHLHSHTRWSKQKSLQFFFFFKWESSVQDYLQSITGRGGCFLPEGRLKECFVYFFFLLYRWKNKSLTSDTLQRMTRPAIITPLALCSWESCPNIKWKTPCLLFVCARTRVTDNSSITKWPRAELPVRVEIRRNKSKCPTNLAEAPFYDCNQ